MTATARPNPSRAQLLELFRARTSLTVTRETTTFRPFTGNEIKYDFVAALARLGGADFDAIAAAAMEDARRLTVVGKPLLWTGVALWLAGAVMLAASMFSFAIPVLLAGSLGFFYGASKLSWAKHDRRLVEDLSLLAEDFRG